MTTLKVLKWSNCFSYGPDNCIILNDAKVTQIVGVNGSGKSSIPLITEEVIFNKNSKGVKKASIGNRYLDGGYFISLLFDADDKEYEIIVDRKTNIKVKLLENGIDISSHTATNTYKTIQDIIGVDFKIFSQLVYQNTNTSLQFLTATDTNRKKFLIDLLHLQEYTNLFEVFKNVSKSVNLEVVSIQSKIDTIEKWLVDNKLGDTTILPMIILEIDTAEDEKQQADLSVEIKNIHEKNKKIIKNNQYKELLNGIDLQKAHSIKITQKESYDQLQEQLGKVSSEINTAKQTLKKISSLGFKCHTCEQDISEEFKNSLIKQEEDIISKGETQREELTRQISEIKSRNQLFELKEKLLRDWETLYRNIDKTLPESTLDEEELVQRLERVRAKLLRAKEQLAESARANEAITRQNTRIQIILEQTEKLNKELEHHIELVDNKKTLLANLEVLKKAFSTNGILAYKIENLVKELEELTNKYLSELSDGQFGLTFVVINDRLTVQITDNGLDIEINELSSGELAKVNTSTLLAIRQLMSSLSKAKINVLFLDEVINVLDSFAREKLVEILLEEEGLNTYLVSHGWTHPLLNKIEVIKEDKMSRLEVI